MIKFHQIPTEKYKPLSHDKEYLFNLYEKISNFLAFNLENDKNHKNKIAKPVRNLNDTDFYAPFPNLKPIEEIENKDNIVNDYFNFIEVVNHKIEILKQAKDENHKDWAKILTEVFNEKNNFVFSNEKEFCIVWGWEFDNKINYKPNIQDKKPSVNSNPFVSPSENFQKNESNNNVNIEEEPFEEEPITIEDDIEEVIIEEIYVDEPIQEKKSFLEFLKWFASTYWWLLLILSSLIIIIFLYKSTK
jgi:hypothetical protein